MLRNVPECAGMFHVPDFIDGHAEVTVKPYRNWAVLRPSVTWKGVSSITLRVSIRILRH